MLSPMGRLPAGMLHVYGGSPPGIGLDGLTFPTAICTEYGVPTCAIPNEVPSGIKAVVVDRVGVVKMVYDWLSAICTNKSVLTVIGNAASAIKNGTLESCTAKLMEKVPKPSGVPLNTPLTLNFKPAGKPSVYQAYGWFPPDACIWNSAIALPT